MGKEFFLGSAAAILFVFTLGFFYPPFYWLYVIVGPLVLLGVRDYMQTRHSVLRNFPVIGHFRYLLELVRPEIQQYFIESNSDGKPFSREERSVIYQRAKKALQTVPFGTQLNVYDVGYTWVNHSMAPIHLHPEDMRVDIGGPDCKQKYSASILNISAMSYGALSKNAIMSLNLGAKMGGFAHNTGEGGLSPYHLQGGDLIWQIGTGYFGARGKDGKFSEEAFKTNALRPEVKMIEIKLSQGAKPGHGGILPAAKITPEIAAIRGVEMGKDVISPPAHTAFSTPVGLLEFVKKLRDLSGGKPVGFKLCLGKRREFLAVCKAMLKTGITPDFITVDGGEGGTGAAPLEFTNQVGSPLTESLIFVHNALVGVNLRDRIKIIASGKVTDGMGIISKIALGADLCNSARGMMLALGCIQALRCHTNHCPVGIATQNPSLTRGVVPESKAQRVRNFHEETIKSVSEILGAMGLSKTGQLRPWHLMRRVSINDIRHYGQLFEYLKPGDLLKQELPREYARAWTASSADHFGSAAEA